jgi:copper homeostasis protein
LDRTKLAGVLEICIDGVASARAAAAGGADRVELCAALPEGGTTPSAGMIRAVRELFPGKLMVIIRPRGHDFLYDDDEIGVMCEDIRVCHRLGVDGVVIGCLAADGRVDRDACGRLLDCAGSLDVTFHRALDMARDPQEALDEVMAMGIRRVLSSGAAADVVAGMPVLRSLIERAGDRCVVMPGGGVTPENLAGILDSTGAREVHLSARQPLASAMLFRNPDCFMGAFTRADEYTRRVTAAADVRRCAEILRQHRREA